MKNLLIIIIIVLLSTVSLYSTNVNGRFVVMTNNGVNYAVKVQLNTDTGTDDLGGASIVFNYNNSDLSIPSSPQSGVDYTYHNFSGGNYAVGTVTRPSINQIWLNIELGSDNNGTIVALAPSWTDVVTINFSTLDPSGNAGLVWQELDGNWFIFDGDNATLWNNGTFTDENTTPLPVELTSFTASVNENVVDLKWQTATELNNIGFNVERRINDEDEWNTIGFVEGSGNSNSTKEYGFSDKDLFAGGSKFQYRLKQMDTDGQFEYSDVVEVEIMPTQFELSQNYPNPFNPSTIIRFSLPKESKLKISIYNMLGELVETLADGTYEAGNHKVTFSAIVGGSASGGNASTLPSGAYIYRIESDAFVQVKKMVLIK